MGQLVFGLRKQVGGENCGQHDEEKHEDLGDAIHTDGEAHVGCGEFSRIIANVGFREELAEVVMRASETTIQDASEGSFGVATVGRSVVAAVMTDEIEN